MAQDIPSTSPKLPSEGVRGIVSLLIVFHLSAILLAASWYTQASDLQLRLGRVFGPYLRTFHFHQAHVYPSVERLYLTHAAEGDVDFTLSVTEGSGGKNSASEERLQVPTPELWPGTRRLREQTLVNVAGALCQAEGDSLETILPQALAGSWLTARGAKSGRVVCRAHFLQDLEEARDLNAPRRDPFHSSFYRNVFDARVLVTSAGVDLLKTSAAGEVAPVRRGPAAGGRP